MLPHTEAPISRPGCTPRTTALLSSADTDRPPFDRWCDRDRDDAALLTVVHGSGGCAKKASTMGRQRYSVVATEHRGGPRFDRIAMLLVESRLSRARQRCVRFGMYA